MKNKDMSTITLLKGDCLEKLKELQDNSIDSVVTDPPYEIGFMGKGWDDSGIANNPELWKEVLRVLKPGGHLLSFSHSRTYHRQAVAVEDAGFEIRDQIMWIYGSGFPKSHNIGKAVDKLQGNEREVVGDNPNVRKAESQKNTVFEGGFNEDGTITKGNSPYEGWGTALKPAHEPIVMARKPFKGSVAQNVLEWGTGGINIDECRVGFVNDEDKKEATEKNQHKKFDSKMGTNQIYGDYSMLEPQNYDAVGRFPANIIFDEEAGKILDEQSGVTKSSKRGAHNNKKTEHTNTYTPPQAMYSSNNTHGDEGGASRFFYCPKASKKDRNEGCDELKQHNTKDVSSQEKTLLIPDKNNDGKMRENPFIGAISGTRTNHHPTVKPTDLMAYLVRMITPKGGVVLDPFMGSGSTGKAAVREGFDFIGIEREDEYMEIAKTRIEYEQKKNKHTQFFDI